MYKYLPLSKDNDCSLFDIYVYSTCEYISSKMTIMYSLLFLSENETQRYELSFFYDRRKQCCFIDIRVADV